MLDPKDANSIEENNENSVNEESSEQNQDYSCDYDNWSSE